MIDRWLTRACQILFIAVLTGMGCIIARHAMDTSYGDCFVNGFPAGRGWMHIGWEERHMVADSIGSGVAEKDVVTGGIICSSFDGSIITLQQKRDAWFWRAKGK